MATEKALNQKNRKITLSIISAIFLLALLLRLFYSGNAALIDIDGYDKLARSIFAGNGFAVDGKPVSVHEPFYSYFLAAIYFLFGYSHTAVRIVQAIIGSATCSIIFLLSKRAFDLKIALISALIASFNPGFIKSGGHLMTENLFTFTFAAGIFFLFKYTQERGFKSLVFLGFTLGVAALTRSVFFFFPLFIILFVLKKPVPPDCSVKRNILSIVIFILCFILPIMPWTIRNWQVHHRFIPICTKGGLGFYSSYVPKDGKLYGFIADDDVTKKSELLSSEAERSNFLFKEAIKYIQNNPKQVLKLEALKAAFFFSPFDWEIIGYGVYNFMYGFYLPFFIFGIVVSIKRLNELLPIYLPIAYAFFIALITYGSPRFRLPVEPYLIIIAAAGVVYFVKRAAHKIVPVLWTSAYFLLNLFLYTNSYQVKVFFRNIFKEAGLW